jgi:hypothetical protein
MEGLVASEYITVVQYKNDKESSNIGSLFCVASSSYSYMKLLADDSGRFQTFASSSSSPFSNPTNSTTQIPSSSGEDVRSLRRRLTNSNRVST